MLALSRADGCDIFKNGFIPLFPPEARQYLSQSSFCEVDRAPSGPRALPHMSVVGQVFPPSTSFTSIREGGPVLERQTGRYTEFQHKVPVLMTYFQNRFQNILITFIQ